MFMLYMYGLDMVRKRYIMFTTIELFAGAGGMALGVEKAGFTTLGLIEIDKDACATLRENRPGWNVVNDDIANISGLDLEEYFNIKKGNLDLLSGGAPCQAFSYAGKRLGLEDARGTLFYHYAVFLEKLQPKMFLFENVKGLFSKAKDGKRGAIFNYICDTFEDRNVKPSYNLVSREQDTILLKACDYGVPQLRERVFLVLIRSDLEDVVKFTYPEKEYGPDRKYPYITVQDAIGDLPKVEMGEETTYYRNKKYKNKNREHFINIMRGKYKSDIMNAIVPKHLVENGLFKDNSISSHKAPGHIKRKQELLALIKEKESMKMAFERLTKEGTISKYRHLFPNTIYSSRNRRLIKPEISFTVTSHCLDEILHPYLDRAISPREAARLQSFPDWYQFEGPYVQFHGDKIQDRYEQIGDAIPPLLAYALAREIIRSLQNI